MIQNSMLSLCFMIHLLYQPTLLVALDKDLTYLLNAHNTIRRYARNCNITGQPQARHLTDLKWSPELAMKALQLSRTCNFRYSQVKSSRFGVVGQNIAAYANAEIAMNQWIDEYKYYDFEKNICNEPCGNYVQIVWQETTHVGCAVTRCKKTAKFPYGMFVVCNYGPGASFKKSPYDVDSYEKCPKTQSRWKNVNLNGNNCYCYK
uniref:Glioma pathogenesis-related protein 1 n=1 Tax=Schistosoma japonicum TaxID=6182 RepID=C1LP44_SCHJA|nr:Glioma pathogenesis-related protein 1 precursor [Schistosoma japonicum]